MATYHAQKNGRPMCGATGTKGGFHAVTVSPKEWNALRDDQKCKRCVEYIRKASKLHHP